MSGIGAPKPSLLPKDIEVKLTEVKNTISNAGIKIKSLNAEIEVKTNELAVVTNSLNEAKEVYTKTIEDNQTALREVKDRENKLDQRESALNVYANALEEKEKKINKYLAIFESMKDVIK